MEDALDGMICSISGSLMTDPMMTVDGHSYQKKAIEEWIKKKKGISPYTGSLLPSFALIPNHNLRRAVEDMIHRNPNLKKLCSTFEMPRSSTSFKSETFSPNGLSKFSNRNGKGCAIELFDERTIAKKISPEDNKEGCIVFIDSALRLTEVDVPTFSVEIIDTITAFRGMMIGVSEYNPVTWDRDMDILIDDYSWYISGSGWLNLVGGGSRMTSWNPGNLRISDKVIFHINTQGNIQIFVNDKKVVDYPAKVPLMNENKGIRNYWGFVGLEGVVNGVALRHAYLPEVNH